MIPSTLLLNPQSHSFSLFPTTSSPLSLSTSITTNLSSSSSSSSSLRFPTRLQTSPLTPRATVQDDYEDDFVIGDCVVFDENAFVEETTFDEEEELAGVEEAENLVPEKWREVQAEINITKKERRKIAQEMEFGTRVEKNRRGLVPLRNVNLEQYLAFREAKLAQLKPLVLDNPESLVREESPQPSSSSSSGGGRVAPRNPRWAVYGKNMNDVTEFFNTGNYNPADQKPLGPRKLFSKDEKVMLNRRIPDLEVATSEKWVPLHTLAASGAFYLVDALLKHKADVNAADKDGWTAIHKAIIGKKQAVTNYLLRESANPFVRDKEGATLMHYAVRTASSQAIKILLLYNVDINLQDEDGWTPLHLAVQSRRLDVVKLLLIKGADKTLKNKDGLTPLEMCLYSGRDTRTYELIKLLKLVPRQR